MAVAAEDPPCPNGLTVGADIEPVQKSMPNQRADNLAVRVNLSSPAIAAHSSSP